MKRYVKVAGITLALVLIVAGFAAAGVVTPENIGGLKDLIEQGIR